VGQLEVAADILGHAPAMQDVFRAIGRLSQSHATVLINGESGTGKELVARALHRHSPRSEKPFIAINTASIPKDLLESELFGHERGAFTGAAATRHGRFEQAEGGTLFLDEIGDLPMDIQVRLLRFLENGEIRPVGADHPSKANVRLLCATHQPLPQLVKDGKFRRDLYYRLASITLQIPPLRSRPEDIAMLSQEFARELGHTISPRAVLRLQAHSWPGNVRELRHAIERACGLCGPFNSLLGEDSFGFLLTPDNVQREPEIEFGPAVLSLDEMEKAVLLKALRISHGNRKNAAKVLGIARSTLFEKIKRHNIRGPNSQIHGFAAA
jgi:two-component system nitrogen regulation response regulator GlnG